VKARREIDDDENDDNMKKTKIDQSDDSMNDLNEIDRRDFVRMNDLIDKFHLLNC
jgi:hypothetical protein